MNSIETTIRDGSINALRQRITCLRHELSNQVWDATESNGRYVSLGKAMTKALGLLAEMRKTLDALQRLDPSQK